MSASKRPGTAATTRMRKAACPRCGYTIRLSRQWIAAGLPACPVCHPRDDVFPLTCPDPEDVAVADPQAALDAWSASRPGSSRPESRRGEPRVACCGCGRLASRATQDAWHDYERMWRQSEPYWAQGQAPPTCGHCGGDRFRDVLTGGRREPKPEPKPEPMPF